MLRHIEGDLLTCNTKYIAHQCNCVTKKAKHLSWDVFRTFPYANIYSIRTKPDKLGTIIVKGNGQTQRFVINMLAQYYPGKNQTKKREKAFLQCLREIYKLGNIESLAFPYGIGCGAAGGNWVNYLAMIEKFAEHVDYPVYIVRKV